ncbi:rod shape-determining protein MreC [Wukongibacter sp. M2B1]|uniref:rod shape-determining protein MreC n=1 Tax=Wukongibacter sp. M2B1 TaxID=3088895 RepID=UPI003D79EFFC
MFNIFKRKIMIVAIVTIILLVIIGITFGGRENLTSAERVVGNTLTPIQRFFQLGSNFISDLVDPVLNIWKLDEENENLREENVKLQNEIIKLKLSIREYEDLKSLRKALNYASDNNIKDYVTCNVIAKDPGNWFSIFTIDVGLKDGIGKNSTVTNGDGLIGLVYEVGDSWAKVITIIDNISRVSFETLSEENGNIGLINGDGDAILKGYLFDHEAEVKIGDKIVTSGLGLYPKGIQIGKIKEVIVKEDELLKSILVEPSVNFKKLDRVFVIPKKNLED